LELRISTGPISVFVLFLAGLVAPVRGDEILVGSVKTVHGGATIHRGQNVIPLSEGAHILLNDTVQTASDGGVGVILQDGTRLSLGPNTEIKIDRFIYQPADGKFALLLQLARGGLAYVSGKIAKFSPGSVTVETPVAILGLRGTEFVVSIEGAAPVKTDDAI
jgi:hypothetical protein